MQKPVRLISGFINAKLIGLISSFTNSKLIFF